jgi:translation elongation factor EF-Tu-like GTPase
MNDIEAKIILLKSDGNRQGKHKPVYSGYRPAHLIRDDYLTTGEHYYYGDVILEPGETVRGTITFITPEAYPRTIWIGKIIRIQEASKIVGYAVVTKIFNELLRKLN